MPSDIFLLETNFRILNNNLYCPQIKVDLEMSRCQHNQRITKFCVTPSCNHAKAGGCQYCFKRYHCHIGQTKFLKEAEVNDLLKYLTSFEDKKLKVRPLKQSIYNYFNIIKGQISTYLDCLSSDLLNKISYPYVKKSGNLDILKKLKHKEYNKVTTEEMIKISEFKQQNGSQKLQKNQIICYMDQVKEVYEKVDAINALYMNFQKQAKESYKGEAIMSVAIFYKKIGQIYQQIQSQKVNYLKKLEQGLAKRQLMKAENEKIKNENSSPQKATTQRKNQVEFVYERRNRNQQEEGPTRRNKNNIQLAPIEIKSFADQSSKESGKKEIRTRKISIDSRCSDLVKSRLKTFEQKQKEISQKRHKLEQMLSRTEKKKQRLEDSSGSCSSEKVGKVTSCKFQEQSLAGSQGKSSRIAPEDAFVHTLLPEGRQEKNELYEQHQTVEKKTLKVPVNVIQENAEDQQCQSPILRLKKSQKQKQTTGSSGFQLGLFKVHPAPNKEQAHSQTIQSHIQVQSKSGSQTSDKQNVKPQPNDMKQMSITQKEANSLFLLVESLKLSAKKAIPLLQAALKYAPNNFSAAQYLTYLYLEQNKPRQCLKACNQALKQISGQPNANQISFHLFNNKAAALNLLGRFSESIPILQKCISVKKKDILYKNLGDAYFSLGINEKAMVNYQNAVILNDQNHEALYNLAVCLYIQKNYNSAKLKLQRALMMVGQENQSYLELYKQINTVLKDERAGK